ncbi:MAG: orotate phosphoribosyltransferase [Clostridiales bacterium]|nr:orotate phosphoribosyltransferase [Clostridiales bacterium]
MGYKREFIEFMVEAGALTFGNFITKSGRETPYFINTGNYRTGAQIARLGRFYAECIVENMKEGKIKEGTAALFGPAYKGIPIAVSTSIALSEHHGREVGFCFNRKEAKDHGEGGVIVGHKIKDGDQLLIVEDVITAGTAVREALPIIMSQASAKISGLVISVDRMERGKGDRTAIQEIKEEFGVDTFPIVTAREIVDELYGAEIGGRILIDDETKEKMEKYFEMYCK